MKRTFIAFSAVVAMLALAPLAWADTATDQTSVQTTVQQDTSTDTSTCTTDCSPSECTTDCSPSECTTDCTPECTTDCTPECTTDCTPECTTDCTPGCITDCVPEECTVDCIPEEECVADCVPNTGVLGEGRGPGVAAGSLPFTGVEDMLMPLLIGFIALMGGFVAYRYAAVREALANLARRPAQVLQRPTSGYSFALRNLDEDTRATGFWGGPGRIAPAS